jgi:GNAT superfamily N-acetyltransferase
MMYQQTTPQGYRIQNTRPEHAAALDELQGIIFPTLAKEERIAARHYLHHIQLFPEGQFVVLDGSKAIGMSSTIRYHLALEDHTFLEISDNLWLNTHEPDGEWMYGMDVGVHPDYRGQGLARWIYRARQETCRSLGLQGQITVGMPNGYANYAQEMSLDDYYNKWLAGEIFDPTVSVQRKMGFEPVRLIHNYLDDPQCGRGGVLMILDAGVEV